MDCKRSPRSSSRVHRFSASTYLRLTSSPTVLLTRALRNSRSGHQRTDNVLKRIVRRVAQIGLLGTIFALAGLTTWFFLQSATIYVIFDMSVGPIYTNVRRLFTIYSPSHFLLMVTVFRLYTTHSCLASDYASAWLRTTT